MKSMDTATTMPPDYVLRRMIMGYMTPQLVRAAALLNIADHLGEDPTPATEMARRLGANPDALTRLLRALAVIGLVEHQEGGFRLTELGRALGADNGRLASMAIAMAGPNMTRPCERIAEAAITGAPVIQDTLGTEFWEYFDKHPEDARHFGETMSYMSSRCAEALPEQVDLSRFQKIVDVGGGQGVLLSGVLRAVPGAVGVLYDRPDVVARSSIHTEDGIADRVSVVAGDFFTEVPPGGDLYLLKNVLCDWNDVDATRVLSAIARAAAPGASLLVVDWALPGSPTGGSGRGVSAGLPLTDLGLLLNTGGRVRTESEFHTLLSTAGFTDTAARTFFDGITEWTLIEARVHGSRTR